MQELTIEQLKFAREIGAVYCVNHIDDLDDGCFGKEGFVYRLEEWLVWQDDDMVSDPSYRFEIDFSPLDALNEEQPLEWPISEDFIGRKVRFDGYLNDDHHHWGFDVGREYAIGMNHRDGIGPINKRSNIPSENYGFKFTLLPKESEEWPEERQDVVGQNGNDGEHYEKPETTHDVSHHKRKDGTDLIDEWWNKYEPEVARVLMWEMVNKYKNRLGKKDPVHIEVAKMADYMARWSEKEFELIK